MTTIEKQFVGQFIKDMNPVRACERMGYDEVIAPDVAYEMLGKPHVLDAIADRLTISKKYDNINTYSPRDFGVTENYILCRLKRIADTCNDKPQAQIRALELLGKTIGIFKDNIKLTEEISVKNAFSPADRVQMLDKLRGTR